MRWLSNDKEIVSKLQKHVPWRTRVQHFWNCQYDTQGRLTYINLSDLCLSSIPPEIGQLSNLQELDLSNNQLTALPPEIGQLANLQRLELSGNRDLHIPPPGIITRGLLSIKAYLGKLGRR